MSPIGDAADDFFPHLVIHENAGKRIASQLKKLSSVIGVRDVSDIEPFDGAALNVVAAWLSGDVFMSQGFDAFGDFLLRAPSLRWVQTSSSGVDFPIFRALAERGVRITKSHVQAIGIAEYVLAQVLDRFQMGAAKRASQRNAVWDRTESREVCGTRWLIVGFGAIGQEIARRARSFGVHITAVRMQVAAHQDADDCISFSDIHATLPSADVVVLCAPATTTTHNLFDSVAFARMKKDSILINVARGELVNEGALVDALDACKLQFAALDVFAREPLPKNSPLWRHPKIVVTSHVAGICDGRQKRDDVLFVENLSRFLRDAPLLNEVRDLV